MARPREFDEQVVIEDAMGAFWSRGYDSTSLSDLTQATGLVKGSIYKGFGDKKQFFMLALESYLVAGTESLDHINETSETGRDAVEAVLAGVVDMATGVGERRGCLVVNSIVELGPHDDDVQARLRRYTKHKEATVAEMVKRGTQDGSLRPDLDPAATARYITTLTNGLQVQGKLGLTKKQAKDTTTLALAAFTATAH